jgi:hypothetical protein
MRISGNNVTINHPLRMTGGPSSNSPIVAMRCDESNPILHVENVNGALVGMDIGDAYVDNIHWYNTRVTNMTVTNTDTFDSSNFYIASMINLDSMMVKNVQTRLFAGGAPILVDSVRSNVSMELCEFDLSQIGVSNDFIEVHVRGSSPDVQTISTALKSVTYSRV